MKVILGVVRWLWWLAVAFVPVAILMVERRYMKSIGCPPSGDCYVPGSEILLEWDTLILASILLLWPVCLWFLGVGPFVKRIAIFVRHRLTSGSSRLAHLRSAGD